MSEWKEYKLDTICSLNAGGDAPQNSTKVPSGKSVVPIFSNGESKKGLYGFTDHYKIEAPAVTISARGNIGYVCLRKENYVPIVRLITAKAKNEFLSNEFLYYSLLNTHICGDGSVQKQLTIPMIAEYRLKIPPKTIQKKIVDVLESFDDKIETNQRINENLEQQAQALFKSWFVDFEPFQNKPFVESELGRIPEGWRVGTLGDITTYKSEKVGENDDIKVLSPVAEGKLLFSEEIFTKQVFSESIANYKIVNIGDFAYNPARINIGSIGRNDYSHSGCVSPVYVVFKCSKDYSNYFDLFRKTEKFKTEVRLRAIGGVRQTLNYREFAMIKIIIAPNDIMLQFDELYSSFRNLQMHLKKINSILTQLRDTLLPRLMSGELEVKDIEEYL